MNFFSRERRLSHLIRTADPLGVAEAPANPSRPRVAWLVLPVAALALAYFGLIPNKKAQNTTGKLEITTRKLQKNTRELEITTTKSKSTTGKLKIAFGKSKNTMEKLEIITKKSRRTMKKSESVMKKHKRTLEKPQRVIEKRERIQEKSENALKESPEAGELIVVAVRPITPDELRQELQTP
jgi:hypothetical protein